MFCLSDVVVPSTLTVVNSNLISSGTDLLNFPDCALIQKDKAQDIKSYLLPLLLVKNILVFTKYCFSHFFPTQQKNPHKTIVI